MKVTRFLNLNVSFFATLYEFHNLDMKKSPSFHDLIGQPIPNQTMRAASVDFVITSTFFIICFVYGGIEWYKRKNQVNFDTSYSMNTLRAFIISIFFIGTPLLFSLNGAERLQKSLVYHIIFNLFLFVFIPAMSILKNDRIRTYFSTKILLLNDRMIHVNV